MRTALFVALLGVGCVHTVSLGMPADPSADRRAATVFAKTVDSLRQALRIPGLAVVVLRDTTVILARGFGFADVERRVPVSPETPFNIASVTKTMSAVVALRLVELGMLDLDRPMKSYAGFSDFCSSARADGGIFFSDYHCDTESLTVRHILSMEANGVPGTRFLYNPPSYSWASRPMAEVGHAPFSELTARMVFEPAHMTRSARIHRNLPLATRLAADLAIPYHIDSTGHPMVSDPPPRQGDGAAGGVISTAMDLARFDIALTTERLLSASSMKSMWTAGRSPSGAALPYGIGWFVEEHAGEQFLWHSGLWEGAYSALYLKIPGRHLTLVMLANSDGLRWNSRLDEAAVERSPFVTALLAGFPKGIGVNRRQ